MARNSAIPPEGVEEILAWLHPDRERAAAMYVQLRHDLTKIFTYRGFVDAEGLTDEVLDRVGRKVHEVRSTYEGDPRLYFRAVASKVVKENIKKLRNQVSFEDAEVPEPVATESDEERSADREECLQTCLKKLKPENRQLIVGYYAKEKQAKIHHRSEMAQQLGISIETLRVKVYRIRLSLQNCIERCLERKTHQK